jgi:aryl-alcohol dehydrogenase-like predicted oxidoreductase
MMTVKLGRTGLVVNKDGFGTVPLQRVSMDEAVRLLGAAVDNGINFIDTARVYAGSEEKIGMALSDKRDSVYIATKTLATTAEVFRNDLETSLRLLNTDYIDVYQFHNPEKCFRPGDGTGLYEAAHEAKKQGKIRFIGFTNHRLPVAVEAAESGLYDTLQFPFSYLSGEKDIALVNFCKEKDVGFIAMKALSGGLLTDISAARAWLHQYENVLPVWGIQREKELKQLFAAAAENSDLTKIHKARINRDRKELCGDFCRGCGYCKPCPVGIPIDMAARMSLILKRMPSEWHLSEEWQNNMAKIENCLHCNECKSKCPYGLDTPALLEKNYKNYKKFLSEKVKKTGTVSKVKKIIKCILPYGLVRIMRKLK